MRGLASKLPLISPRRMREHGLVGMNRRNADFVSIWNPRASYPMVDDKLQTKKLAEEAGIATPELYATVEADFQVRKMHEQLRDRDSFVIKPAHGSGGNGILVVTGKVGKNYQKSSGDRLSPNDVSHYVSNVLSGMFSLGGQPDHAVVEALVQFDETFEHISYQGVPDIRVIVFRGIPVAAMVRLPTRESDGKANLHQGAVGVGIAIASGKTNGGVARNIPVAEHPDTGNSLAGVQVPDWQGLLNLSARCADMVDLGYLGVDIVLDANRGPLMLELNARPGLNVQLANGFGLSKRLADVAAMDEIPEQAEDRVKLAQRLF